MAEFEDKLNSILGNQEAMNQIMALARSLSGDQQPSPSPQAPLEEAPGPPAGDPPDLSALLGQVDPRLLQTGMEVLRQAQSTEDRSTALLNALRPFLREDRRARLDRALQISRMVKVLRMTMGALGEKEGERV